MGSHPPGLRSRLHLVLFAAAVGSTCLAGAALIGSQWAFRTAMDWLDEELREARSSRFQDPEALHLLFVGDSFTAGEMSESERGYWAYVPDEVGRLRPDLRIETRSVALAGSTTYVHNAQLEAFLTESEQRVDGVVVVSGVNNWDSLHYQRRYVQTTGAVPLWIQALYSGPKGLLFGLHYPGSRLGIAEVGDPQQVLLDPIKNFWNEDEAFGDWLKKETDLGLRRLRTRAEAAGARLWIGSYISHSMSDTLKAFAATEGLPYFDTQGASVELAYRKAGFFAEDGWHLNDAGNRDLARRWSSFFVAQLPPPSSTGPLSP